MGNGGTKKEKRRTFSKEFKIEAVRLLEGRAASEVGASLGVSTKTLYLWRSKLRKSGDEAFSGHGHRSVLEEENYQLKRRVKELEMEQAILKKAATYFAKHLG
jgi:transposase